MNKQLQYKGYIGDVNYDPITTDRFKIFLLL